MTLYITIGLLISLYFIITESKDASLSGIFSATIMMTIYWIFVVAYALSSAAYKKWSK